MLPSGVIQRIALSAIGDAWSVSVPGRPGAVVVAGVFMFVGAVGEDDWPFWPFDPPQAQARTDNSTIERSFARISVAVIAAPVLIIGTSRAFPQQPGPADWS